MIGSRELADQGSMNAECAATAGVSAPTTQNNAASKPALLVFCVVFIVQPRHRNQKKRYHVMHVVSLSSQRSFAVYFFGADQNSNRISRSVAPPAASITELIMNGKHSAPTIHSPKG